MALTSTGFMAAPGLYGIGNQPDRLDVSEVLAAILLDDTSTLAMVSMKGTVHNIEHFWFEDKLNETYVSGSLSMGADNSTAIFYFSNASSSTSINQIARSGSLIRPDGYDIIWKMVTASNSTSLIPHTSVTNITSVFVSVENQRCLVVGMPKADTATFSEDISRARSRRKNYTQVFERGLEIAETRKHQDLYAVADELKLQIKNRTYEIKKELNNSLLNSRAYWNGGAATPDSEVSRTFSGIIEQIRDPALSGTRTNNTATAISGALTMTNINQLVQDIFDRGGFDSQSNVCAIVGAKQSRVVALLEEQRIRKSNTELVVGSYNNKIKTDMGFDIPVVIDRWLPPDLFLLLDKSRVSCKPLKGDTWHLERMAKTKRTDGFQLSGQYTCEVRNADEAHGLLYDLSYS